MQRVVGRADHSCKEVKCGLLMQRLYLACSCEELLKVIPMIMDGYSLKVVNKTADI